MVPIPKGNKTKTLTQLKKKRLNQPPQNQASIIME